MQTCSYLTGPHVSRGCQSSVIVYHFRGPRFLFLSV